jgi:NAD(P)-dependent dehydrogenase (short-subunit alcohol dehydrogenase family)
MADDKMLREMTSDPKFRKALVTDGKTETGQAIVRALVKAGADIVWVGHAEPWKKMGDGLDDISALPQVTLVPLDLTNGRQVTELAGSIGGKVDIVINNAEVHRTFGIGARRGTDVAKAEMDINYFGLLRLAQEFGPALKGRSADGATGATAWVNLLSIYALSNFPPHGTFSASKAAAHSLAQCLRAEMRPAGIRVINVFPGPIDDEWNQHTPPPKLAPTALGQRHREGAARRRRRRLSRRRGAGVAGALARQPEGARTRTGRRRLKKEPTMTTTTDLMSAAEILGGLVTAMASGRIRVIDLTQTLTPEFPQIALPPEMGQCWPFRIEEVSKYDERGPGWYWNNFSCGEHTGTHFDAPIHWISGRDLPNNSVDTIPVQNFVAPACVIDCSAMCRPTTTTC